MVKTAKLTTEYEKNIPEIPFSEYPRPMLKRDSYICLNGQWDFTVERNGEKSYSGKILVPFVPESRISGVEKPIEKGDLMIYQRSFTINPDFHKGRLILHIGACDQKARVYVNEALVAENIGGYLPIDVDITDFAVIGENALKVIARDDMDITLPYGKQTSKRGGMWYTKVSGIWQTVWLESVPQNYIEKIYIKPDLKGVDIRVIGNLGEKTIAFQGREYAFSGESFRLDVDNPILWSPENPHLYDFTLTSGDDKIQSYFALRTIEIKEINDKSYICLNGEPYFFNGLLDQGYFSDGIFLPATEKGFEDDIRTMKECGFNMLRKHIKLEPDIFYYYCDKIGMTVFQDFVNSGKYSFFLDTALPTIGLKRGITHKATFARREYFKSNSLGTMDILYNHPSVVYYTIFNEGWGQYDADENYKLFKEQDNTRIFDTTSGWFFENLTDVESHHVYFKPVKLKSVKGKPLVLSEFGGYSYIVEGHTFNLDKNYGYKTFKSQKELEEGLIKLYENEIIPAIKEQGLNAAVLTQVSDVEDETNGLLTYDRKVLKVNKDFLKNYDFNKLLLS